MVNGRRAGVLMPIFSLPGEWGIGSFSKHATEFVERLAEAEQSIWQVLPLGPTGYGDSPYQSFSTFAGNPYFIDLDQLVAAGLLSRAELEARNWGNRPDRVDYGALFASRDEVLRLAHSRTGTLAVNQDFVAFTQRSAAWLDDYALFRTIKRNQGGRAWTRWPLALRDRDPQAIAAVRGDYAAELDFQRWLQWIFDQQWQHLHDSARDAGVSILGDLPIYVAMDSADAWANRELFDMAVDGTPREVAAVPPDGFSATGQLWGNPLYNWPVHRQTGYEWWIARLRHQLANFDMVRLDHFRGLESYYAVPSGDADASGGRWYPGPGLELFEALESALGELPMVAEDLGYLTDDVRRLRDDSGLPGMQIIQFAFDSREPADYWPHNFVHNTVVYTGTHDNDTLLGWFDSLSEADRDRARSYLNAWWTPADKVHQDFILAALTSVAQTCIVPMADHLGMGSDGRINTPATAAGNWQWRMTEGAFSHELAAQLASWTRLVERNQ